jgi:hypothetical protein
VQSFPIRRSRWALPFLVLLAPGRHAARIDHERLSVRMGLLGRADVPLRLVERVGAMRWPWWAGVGVRIASGMVAFVGASGRAAVLELSEPIAVWAPLRWRTSRIAIGAEDVDGLMAALAEARGGAVGRLHEGDDA